MEKRQLFTIINFVVLAALDNGALAMIPAFTKILAERLATPDYIFVFITGITTLVATTTSLVWGYWGDKTSRKKLLFVGTIIWSVMIFCSAMFGVNWILLLIFHVIAGFGLGCIASVGFSIIVDFVPPKRRGLAMSLWGFSQGAGSAIGYIFAFVFVNGWNISFLILAIITFGFILTFPLTKDPERGATEEDLKDLREKGIPYDYTIKRKDLGKILRTKTNWWIIGEAFFSQMIWGTFQFLNVLFTYKLLEIGLALETAHQGGEIIAGVFAAGAVGSLVFGILGDRYHKKNLRARPLISSIGTLIAIPLFIIALLLPLYPLFIPSLALAFVSVIFMHAEDPNDLAMLSDLNLPEHRGTMFGLMNAISGFGRTLGIIILAIVLALFYPVLGSAQAWVFGMVIVQFFMIFAGGFFALAIWTTPADVHAARKVLKMRGEKPKNIVNDSIN